MHHKWTRRGGTVLTQHHSMLAEILAVLYMVIITALALTVGPFFLLFPELGALSYEVLRHPHGRWASAPWHLATSPALAGVVGIAIARTLPYGISAVLLTVVGIIALVTVVRSPIGPAISAGLLPLVLGITSWWYPLAILVGCSVLTGLVFLWKRIAGPHVAETRVASCTTSEIAAREAVADPSLFWRAGPTLAFTLLAVLAVSLTGLRFLLYPPLVVMTYEMFSYPGSCPWAQRPLHLPVACCLTASMGFGWYSLCGVSVLTALGSLACGIMVLRLLALRVPPALAVALLPLVIHSPTIAYPIAVSLGTSLLSLWFLSWRGMVNFILKPPMPWQST